MVLRLWLTNETSMKPQENTKFTKYQEDPTGQIQCQDHVDLLFDVNGMWTQGISSSWRNYQPTVLLEIAAKIMQESIEQRCGRRVNESRQCRQNILSKIQNGSCLSSTPTPWFFHPYLKHNIKGNILAYMMRWNKNYWRLGTIYEVRSFNIFPLMKKLTGQKVLSQVGST